MKTQIYTVDYCPYCKKAIVFLKEHGVEFSQQKIDEDEDTWRKKLGEMFNIKGEVTVPQIVINEQYIGGYTDMIAKYNSGELKL